MITTQELCERIRATNQIARKNAKQAKNQAKKQYDKTVREKIFQVGDEVLLYDKTRTFQKIGILMDPTQS